VGVDGPAAGAVLGGVTSLRRGAGASLGPSFVDVLDLDRLGRIDRRGVDSLLVGSAFLFLGVCDGVGVADDRGEEVGGGVLPRFCLSCLFFLFVPLESSSS
jgi:hypothetical protein